MNISELWMRLEALAHLRGLPQYAAIKAQVESEVAEYNESLKPKAAPKAAPVAVDEPPPEVERRT